MGMALESFARPGLSRPLNETESELVSTARLIKASIQIRGGQARAACG